MSNIKFGTHHIVRLGSCQIVEVDGMGSALDLKAVTALEVVSELCHFKSSRHDHQLEI